MNTNIFKSIDKKSVSPHKLLQIGVEEVSPAASHRLEVGLVFVPVRLNRLSVNSRLRINKVQRMIDSSMHISLALDVAVCPPLIGMNDGSWLHHCTDGGEKSSSISCVDDFHVADRW